MIGGGQNFISIGPIYENDQYPCYNDFWSAIFCVYSKPPDDLMKRIWGPLSSECNYKAGSAQTAWTFGCSVGVDVNASIKQNTWGFLNHTGNFQVYFALDCPPSSCPGDAAGSRVAQTRRRPPIMLGRRRQLGPRRAVRGRAYLRAQAVIPRMRLEGATVRLGRLLFERGGRGELTRLRGRPARQTLTLRRTASGRFTAASPGRSRARIVLRRVGAGRRVALRLWIGAARLETPRACHALPAAVAIDTPPLQLETRLYISNARTPRHRILLHHRVRCRRDSRANIHRLAHVRPGRPTLRSGLALTLRGPKQVQPGTRAGYVARVHNRRRGNRRHHSSLWDVTLFSRRGSARIHELRRGRSRTLTFTHWVPRNSARRRFCVEVGATAPGARGAHAQACSRIGAAGAPGVTGESG